eukprot:TRINITY_DN8908_c0_g1_i1.p1 TRINITY_DN8908_c0_g1~~TRINITY_DN8908_c0_g1_i1.p1  ORF type:complete len:406 (-),score=44.18 TRINITY_DN8908_c0_g1_i1:63-1280(-)
MGSRLPASFFAPVLPFCEMADICRFGLANWACNIAASGPTLWRDLCSRDFCCHYQQDQCLLHVDRSPPKLHYSRLHKTAAHTNFFVRVRPLTSAEFSQRATVLISGCCIEFRNRQLFHFPTPIFQPHDDQEAVYCGLRRRLFSTLTGPDSQYCVVGFGDAGTGKTYTLIGNGHKKDGLLPRFARDLFRNPFITDVAAGILQVHEDIFDILAGTRVAVLQRSLRGQMHIRLHPQPAARPVTSLADLMHVLQVLDVRRVRHTHTLYRLHFSYRDQPRLVTFVDLASSETIPLPLLSPIKTSLEKLVECVNYGLQRRTDLPVHSSKLTAVLEKELASARTAVIWLASVAPASTEDDALQVTHELSQVSEYPLALPRRGSMSPVSSPRAALRTWSVTLTAALFGCAADM